MSNQRASSARADASRRNGAKSSGPKTEEGKVRSSQNAMEHGMRAQKYVVLPEEDAAEFEALEAALLEELAPQGALHSVLARRVAIAAWRLARADRLEVEVFAERHFPGGGPGLALIRDGNGTRSFETLLRYRGAAMAELLRALLMVKALQAEAEVPLEGHAVPVPRARAPQRHVAPAAIAGRPSPRQLELRNPKEPEITADEMSNEPEPGARLHEAPARWRPNEADAERKPNEPEPRGAPGVPLTAKTRRNPGRAGARPALGQRSAWSELSGSAGRR